MFSKQNFQQYVVKDDALKAYVFENFESAMEYAFSAAAVDKMVIFAMPNGEEFTIMRRPRQLKR
jgi:hypothetical protein